MLQNTMAARGDNCRAFCDATDKKDWDFLKPGAGYAVGSGTEREQGHPVPRRRAVRGLPPRWSTTQASGSPTSSVSAPEPGRGNAEDGPLSAANRVGGGSHSSRIGNGCVVSVATALLLATAMNARAQLTAIDASCTGGRFARVCDTQPDGASAVGGDDENGDMANDNRQNLLTSAYLGTAIDNFAGSEIRRQ